MKIDVYSLLQQRDAAVTLDVPVVALGIYFRPDLPVTKLLEFKTGTVAKVKRKPEATLKFRRSPPPGRTFFLQYPSGRQMWRSTQLMCASTSARTAAGSSTAIPKEVDRTRVWIRHAVASPCRLLRRRPCVDGANELVCILAHHSLDDNPVGHQPV